MNWFANKFFQFEFLRSLILHTLFTSRLAARTFIKLYLFINLSWEKCHCFIMSTIQMVKKCDKLVVRLNIVDHRECASEGVWFLLASLELYFKVATLCPFRIIHRLRKRSTWNPEFPFYIKNSINLLDRSLAHKHTQVWYGGMGLHERSYAHFSLCFHMTEKVHVKLLCQHHKSNWNSAKWNFTAQHNSFRLCVLGRVFFALKCAHFLLNVHQNVNLLPRTEPTAIYVKFFLHRFLLPLVFFLRSSDNFWIVVFFFSLEAFDCDYVRI